MFAHELRRRVYVRVCVCVFVHNIKLCKNKLEQDRNYHYELFVAVDSISTVDWPHECQSHEFLLCFFFPNLYI